MRCASVRRSPVYLRTLLVAMEVELGDGCRGFWNRGIFPALRCGNHGAIEGTMRRGFENLDVGHRAIHGNAEPNPDTSL